MTTTTPDDSRLDHEDLWYRRVNPTSYVAYRGNQAIAEATYPADLKKEVEKLGLNFRDFANQPLRIARVL